MSREIERLRDTWRVLGAEDPLWAILSRPDKRGGRWDIDEFFRSGESEIAAIDNYCAHLARPQRRGLAVDFGCGVGRLTRALASRYERAIGVDIASSMLARARELHADQPNLQFFENALPDLRFLADGSVDLLYSVITLHHMPATLQRQYIAEFVRVIAPDGLAVFQIASGYSGDAAGWAYRLLPNRLLAPLRKKIHAIDVAAEMHTIDEDEVVAMVRAANRNVLFAENVDSAGRGFRGRLLFIG